MQLSISEILDKADKAPTEEEKINILRKEYSQPLVDVLMGAFDSRIEWLLPSGEVPYSPTKAIGQESNLYMETRRFYLFVKNGHPTIKQIKREQLFIEMLEHLNPSDSKLMVFVKDKKLPYPTITPDLFRKAYPNLSLVTRNETDIPPQALIVAETPKTNVDISPTWDSGADLLFGEVPDEPTPVATVKKKRVPWNKGLTKDDPRVARNIEAMREKSQKGKKGEANVEVKTEV